MPRKKRKKKTDLSSGRIFATNLEAVVITGTGKDDGGLYVDFQFLELTIEDKNPHGKQIKKIVNNVAIVGRVTNSAGRVYKNDFLNKFKCIG